MENELIEEKEYLSHSKRNSYRDSLNDFNNSLDDSNHKYVNIIGKENNLKCSCCKQTINSRYSFFDSINNNELLKYGPDFVNIFHFMNFFLAYALLTMVIYLIFYFLPITEESEKIYSTIFFSILLIFAFGVSFFLYKKIDSTKKINIENHSSKKHERSLFCLFLKNVPFSCEGPDLNFTKLRKYFSEEENIQVENIYRTKHKGKELKTLIVVCNKESERNYILSKYEKKKLNFDNILIDIERVPEIHLINWKHIEYTFITKHSWKLIGLRILSFISLLVIIWLPEVLIAYLKQNYIEEVNLIILSINLNWVILQIIKLIMMLILPYVVNLHRIDNIYLENLLNNIYGSAKQFLMITILIFMTNMATSDPINFKTFENYGFDFENLFFRVLDNILFREIALSLLISSFFIYFDLWIEIKKLCRLVLCCNRQKDKHRKLVKDYKSIEIIKLWTVFRNSIFGAIILFQIDFGLGTLVFLIILAFRFFFVKLVFIKRSTAGTSRFENGFESIIMEESALLWMFLISRIAVIYIPNYQTIFGAYVGLSFRYDECLNKFLRPYSSKEICEEYKDIDFKDDLHEHIKI
jgi:hypothetical protein